MSNKKFVSARGGENRSVIYQAADGAEFLYSGGSRAWRNGNPGNLRAADTSIGNAGGFAVFADLDSGMAALKSLLKRKYAGMKLDAVFSVYAPSTDNNDPDHYAKQVKKWTGLDSNKTVGELSDAELEKYMAAIKRAEGWIPGKIEEIPHAAQFEVKSVDGKPLSGIAYVMSFFTKSGDEKTISGTTDKAGKTQVVKAETKTPVTLKLPRPNPGQSIKAGAGDKAPTGKQVVAAEVKAKPWYSFVFGNAEPSTDPKDPPAPAAAPAAAPKTGAKPKPPTTVVKQAGAIKTSATKKKEDNHVEQVIKEPGLFVTWKFDTSAGSGKQLNGLPYFIAEMNGDRWTPLVEGQKVHLMTGNKIRQKVPFGKSVVLYLGSDAKAKYRTKPMYQVKAEEGFTDIVVVVREKSDKVDLPGEEIPHDDEVSGTKKTWVANLYGTTWMNFTHKFTLAEAQEMAADGGEYVLEAVKKIYRGEPEIAGTGLVLNVKKQNNKTMKIQWPAEAFNNCKQRIPSTQDPASWRTEIIPRVNPNTYQAFIQAAFDMDAEEIVINSGWRPMLGSVLHRIGVGLDVGSVKVDGHAKLFKRPSTQAEASYNAALAETHKLEKKKHRTPDEEKRLNELKATNSNKAKAASDAIKSSDNDLRQQYLAKLRGNAEVRQTFDPWEMENNTRDAVAPTQNHSGDGNQQLHLTHLHITVFDAELGHG